MRSKLMRVTAIALIVGTALAALGAGAALWNSTIAVNGKVNSGKVSAQITHAFTDDDDVVNFPFLDGNDTGQCQDVGHVALPGSTTSSCDPAASGRDPKPRFPVDVARCDASFTAGTATGQIVKTNVYPGYFCTAWFALQNNGTIPEVISDSQLCDANGCHSVPPGVVTPLDLNGDGASDVAIDITEIQPCQQINPGETILFDVDQQVLGGIQPGKSLTEKVQIIVSAFTTASPNCPSPTPVLTPPPTTTPLPTPTPCPAGANCPTPTPCVVTPNCPTPTPPCTGANCPTPTPCTAAACVTPTPTPCAFAVCTPTPTPVGSVP